MKKQQLNHRNKLGLILFGLGVAIWTIPLLLVFVDNVIGTTKPADLAINGPEVLLITAGPLLALIGLFLLVFKFAKHLFK